MQIPQEHGSDVIQFVIYTLELWKNELAGSRWVGDSVEGSCCVGGGSNGSMTLILEVRSYI